jgi:hypothetical protein
MQVIQRILASVHDLDAASQITGLHGRERHLDIGGIILRK